MIPFPICHWSGSGGTPTTFEIDSFEVYILVSTGETVTTIDWACTTDHFGGTTVGSGTVTPAGWTSSLVSSVGSFDTYKIKWTVSLTGLAAGTYWLELSNVDDSASDGQVYWDLSMGSSDAWGDDGVDPPFDLSTLGDLGDGSGTNSESFSVGGTDSGGAGTFYNNITTFTGGGNGIGPITPATNKITNSFPLPIP